MSAIPAHHYKQTYTKADLENLFTDFQIPAVQHQELAQLLEDAAALCRWHRQSTASKMRPSKASSALSKVAKTATKLGEALRDLPDQAHAALATEYVNCESTVILARSDNKPLPKGVALYVPQADGSKLPIVPDQDDILDIIAHLAEVATKAADIPSGSVGVKRDPGLRMWITNIEMFWTKTLARSFSRDVTPIGEPVSEAARFCVATFKSVSPEIPPSRVLQEMKLCIKNKRRKATGRIAKQNDM